MARKKEKKTVKIEIPIPKMPSSEKTKEKLHDIKESIDLEKGKEFITEDVPNTLRTIPGRLKQLPARLKNLDVEQIKEYSRKNYKPLSVITVLLIAIIAVGLAPLLAGPPSQQPQSQTGPRLVTRTRTVTEIVPVNVSFDEYFQNYADYDGQVVHLKGFLRNRVGTGVSKVHTYYVVDDNGQEVTLTDIVSWQRALFVVDGTTTELFTVTGEVDVKYVLGTFELKVQDIAPATREFRTETNTITETVEVWD